MNEFLVSTHFIDSDNTSLQHFTQAAVEGKENKKEQAIALYRAVRDGIVYDPYNVSIKKEDISASLTLERGKGYCIEKALVLAAGARYLGIPSRLGFANVRNHLSSKKFVEYMRTDVFVFHGYVDLYLNEKWVKATPAFDQGLCERFGVSVLEFNGEEDSIFHEFNADEFENGKAKGYMEYLEDHGTFADMPLELFVKELIKYYPHFFDGGKNFKQ